MVEAFQQSAAQLVAALDYAAENPLAVCVGFAALRFRRDVSLRKSHGG